MANYSAFLQEVLPEVPGVPRMVAINAIRNAAIEFCQRGMVWHYEVATFQAIALQADYVSGTEFNLPANSLISQLNFVYYDNNKLITTNQDRLDNISYHWRSRDPALPTRAYMIDTTTLRFVDTPLEVTTDGIDMGVFLKPDRTSTAIADDIFDQYLEEIAGGAVARILMQGARPWGNPAAGKAKRDKFLIDCGRAKIRSLKSYTRSSKIVNLKPFGGSFA